MLSNLKNFVKQNQPDIFITLTIALVAVTSFGLGRLTVPQSNNEPIIIQNPEYTASIEQSVEQSVSEKIETKQGRFVGSVNSNKYHHPDCPWAKKIASQNQVWFSSEEKAQKVGYSKCNSFEKYNLDK